MDSIIDVLFTDYCWKQKKDRISDDLVTSQFKKF